jgi:hypothetical protein
VQPLQQRFSEVQQQQQQQRAQVFITTFAHYRI